MFCLGIPNRTGITGTDFSFTYFFSFFIFILLSYIQCFIQCCCLEEFTDRFPLPLFNSVNPLNMQVGKFMGMDLITRMDQFFGVGFCNIYIK